MGQGLEAALSSVLLTIVIDRLTLATATKTRQ